jgi:inosose dehydratase
MRFLLGNAPCSWGTIEGTAGERIGYAQMLSELAAAGFTGTELGDWGYMPTDPEALKDELATRGLSLIGSWVTVRLTDAAYHQEGIEQAVKVARLLAAVGGPACTINIGDDHSASLTRQQHAGRIKPEHSLDARGWQTFIEGVHNVAEAVRGETGLRSCLHPHGATYVETPAEVREFLARSNPELVGIVFDTGHYMLGGGDPVADIQEYGERIWLMHLKDFEPQVLADATVQNWDYTTMIGQGVFCELGKGAVDFPGVIEALKAIGYSGWLVVEQDVLPGMGSPAESATRNYQYLKSLGL